MTADFKIRVSFSPDSNDHQVRYAVDGRDLIASHWGDMLGLDPDDVLTEPCRLVPSEADGAVTVARCSCGETGCGSEEVLIREHGGSVEWLSGGACVLSVDAIAYMGEVGRALADFTWETPDRTAARLFKTRFDPATLRGVGFFLNWASGRVREEKFTAAFTLRAGGAYQVLVSVPWRRIGIRRRPVPPAVVADDLLAEVAKGPQRWNDVEWSSMEQGLSPPKCGGPKWRPLTTR